MLSTSPTSRITHGPRRTGLRGGSGVRPDTMSKGSPLGTAGLGIVRRSDPLVANNPDDFARESNRMAKSSAQKSSVPPRTAVPPAGFQPVDNADSSAQASSSRWGWFPAGHAGSQVSGGLDLETEEPKKSRVGCLTASFPVRRILALHQEENQGLMAFCRLRRA